MSDFVVCRVNPRQLLVQQIAQQLYIPHYDQKRPVEWLKIFDKDKPITVEIGFGLGEFLVQSALDNPDRVFIGIEIAWKRILKCFRRVAGLSPEERDKIYRQVRIIRADAWVVFERLLRPKMLDRVECLFPCPWPKERHEHHRLFDSKFLRLVNSRLSAKGVLRIVTDYRPYADWILEQNSDGFRVHQETIGARFSTKFERKWTAGGQQKFYELVFQKQKHFEIGIEKDIAMKAYYHDTFFPQQFCLDEVTCKSGVIVVKETVYDETQKKFFVRVIVSEPHLTQHVWITVVFTEKGKWCVVLADGQQVLPTQGVAQAIRAVSDAVKETKEQRC